MNGANFPSPAQSSAPVNVTWNGTTLQTTYVNSGQLTAVVPASLVAAAGTASVTINTQPQPSPLTFTINAPPLVLTGISPTGATAGSPGFTLTVNGSGFTYATTVTWNGASLTTSFVSANQLTATVPANLLTTAGTASVCVIAPGQTEPTPISFAINPVLTSLSPTSATAGGPAFTLTATGVGFSTGATLYWGALALTTTVVSASQLTASVPASYIAQTGTVAISASSGGRTSSALSFTIGTAAVTLSSLTPNTAIAGSPAFTLTVNGTGFAYGATVIWNGSPLNTTFASSVQLTAPVPANLIASVGSVSVGVSVPGQVSPTPLIFTITPSLTLTSLSPSSAAAGGPTFTLSVNGAGFATGTNVLWNGLVLSTAVANANLLTATVPANLIAQQGTVSITAQNGSVVSNALSFSITAPQATVTLTSLSPGAAPAGSPGFTLTVNGSGFTLAPLARAVGRHAGDLEWRTVDHDVRLPNPSPGYSACHSPDDARNCSRQRDRIAAAHIASLHDCEPADTDQHLARDHSSRRTRLHAYGEWGGICWHHRGYVERQSAGYHFCIRDTAYRCRSGEPDRIRGHGDCRCDRRRESNRASGSALHHYPEH